MLFDRKEQKLHLALRENLSRARPKGCLGDGRGQLCPSRRLVTEGGLSAWTVLGCVDVENGLLLLFHSTELLPWAGGCLGTCSIHGAGLFPGRVSQCFGEKWDVGEGFPAVVVVFFPLPEALGCAMGSPGNSTRHLTQQRATVPESRDWPRWCQG